MTDSAQVLLPPSVAFERHGVDAEVGVLRLSRTAKRNALDDATALGLEALSPGQAGEIQIQGPNVVPGYWRRPDATAESFADGVWFRSGDIGHVDDGGFLFISDRLKDMIISGGEIVYPAELDAVSSVAVVGVPDPRWGEVPRAYVQLKDRWTLDDGAIQRHLDGRLARYKIPRTVVVVEELPRTPSGKIRKRDLRVAPDAR
jgi:fatty-acyl-CoA synthase